MAYANASAPRNRLPVVASVAAIHVALGYALVIGLANSGIPDVLTVITGTNIPVEPPKPPPQPEVKPVDAAPLAPLTAPQPLVDLTRSIPDVVAIDPVLLPPLRPAMGDAIIPLPVITPSFAPKSAAPRGNPGNWVTANDYPANDLRLEHQGLTRIALAISSGGRVENCTVTGSSGFASLDQMACAKITARAKFNPAIDDTGARVAGRYATTIRWEIPD
ncbi:MAG TPA: TonB family protein [Novosphingobium sp.]|nr:TonB family protein [Novosphingobium sp.]